MEKRRFKRNRIASSERYYESSRAYKKYLKENHDIAQKVSIEIEQTLKVKYVKCFGKVIEITESEYKTHKSITVI